MIVIAGNWEIGYNSPIIEAHQWALPLRDLGADKWLMTPVSGIRNQEHQSLEFEEYANYEEMIEAYSHLTRVFLEPINPKQGVHKEDIIWLHEFEHPEDCIYIFGSAHFNPVARFKRDGDYIVTIKTKKDNGVLWSAQCAAIALYDRNLKKWQ